MAGKPVEELIFLLARPVGAKRAILAKTSIGEKSCILIYNFTMALIMVVFPVPGPPEIIVILFSKALRIAFF